MYARASCCWPVGTLRRALPFLACLQFPERFRMRIILWERDYVEGVLGSGEVI